jgi:hypothetical protein
MYVINVNTPNLPSQIPLLQKATKKRQGTEDSRLNGTGEIESSLLSGTTAEYRIIRSLRHQYPSDDQEKMLFCSMLA